MIILEKAQLAEHEDAVSPEPRSVGVAFEPRLDQVEGELHET